MKSEEKINQILNNKENENKAVLLAFEGDNCKWCKKLKEILNSETNYEQTLQYYCQINNIKFEWVKLAPKVEEAEEANSCEGGACKITTRNKFGIRSIPTMILFSKNKEIMAKTEYRDGVEEKRGKEYIEWVSQILFPKKIPKLTKNISNEPK